MQDAWLLQEVSTVGVFERLKENAVRVTWKGAVLT